MPRSKIATFKSKDANLQLDVIVKESEDKPAPVVEFQKQLRSGMLGEGLSACIEIQEGQTISFVLRDAVPDSVEEDITALVLDSQQHDTQTFWHRFISQSEYKGRWREAVSRSLMLLKLMTYGMTYDMLSFDESEETL